jgi:predicted PurR-regulated permease PerM
MFRKIFILLLFALHIFSTTTYAIKVAPRITDREIVEKLSKLEAGQAALNQRISDVNNQLNQRINDLDKKLNQRIDDLDKKFSQRIDDLTNTVNNLFVLTITLSGIMATLIAGLFGYIIWDRRTMMKPIQEKVEQLERDFNRELDLHNDHGSVPARLIKALRELAKTDEKLAAVLRSFSLL